MNSSTLSAFPALQISPDGHAVVIATERADWDQQTFRKDLWLYHDDGKSGSLIQLTQSGHDSDPKWSPDGKWIAFLSERKTLRPAEEDADSDSDSSDGERQPDLSDLAQWRRGHRRYPRRRRRSRVLVVRRLADHLLRHASALDQAAERRLQKEWKDVVQYRTAERGDTIFALDCPRAGAPLRRSGESEEEGRRAEDKHPDLTPGARAISTMPLRVDRLVTSPDGTKLAILSNAINQRQEKYEDVEIYTVI